MEIKLVIHKEKKRLMGIVSGVGIMHYNPERIEVIDIDKEDALKYLIDSSIISTTEEEERFHKKVEKI